jgi:hypothetical protein
MENSTENSATLQQSVLDLSCLVARSEKKTLRLERLLRRSVALLVSALFLVMLISIEWVPKAEATDDIQEIRKEIDTMNKILVQISVVLNTLNQPGSVTGLSPIQHFDNIATRVDTILNDVTSKQSRADIDNIIENLSSLRDIREALVTVPQMGRDMRNMSRNMANMTNNLAIISNNTGRMSHDVRNLSNNIGSGSSRMGAMEWMPR